jgi:signal transduction histidine kinase
MSKRGHFRFLWVDLSILLAILFVAWAIFQLGKTEPTIATESRSSEELQSVFQECQALARESVQNSERVRRRSDLEWQETMLLQDEYFNVADHLKNELPALGKAVEETAKSKNATPQAQKVSELKVWIQTQKDRARVERLENQTRELRARMKSTQLSGTNGSGAIEPILISVDLGTLVADIDRNYQQYLSNFTALAENRGKPMVGTIIAQHLASAKQALSRLDSLANQARQESQAIDSWLEVGLRSDSAKRNRREIAVAQALLEAGSPDEFMQRIGRGTSVSESALTAASLSTAVVGRIRYVLWAALAGLIIFLILDVYRRIVVGPLHLKLVQREEVIEHQRKLARFEELAAGIAHEIRNPLTTISARLYTVQRKLHEGTAEYDDATVIGKEIERINFILKEFIQVTRPAPPKLELLNATPLLEDVSHLMAPQLERQAVKLEVETPAQAKFYGDELQLKQVLVNLVQNAAESMEDHGEVILRAREEEAPFKGAVKRVAIIEVEDNGPGIRAEVAPRLFEPFFSTKKEGTGLGLPISARIIDGLGGTLDFETEPDRGTIFRIKLPGYGGD